MATNNYKENKYLQKNTSRLQLIDEIIATHNYQEGALDRKNLNNKVNKILNKENNISYES